MPGLVSWGMELGLPLMANSVTKMRRTCPPPEGLSHGGGSYFTDCTASSSHSACPLWLQSLWSSTFSQWETSHGLQQAGSSGKV